MKNFFKVWLNLGGTMVGLMFTTAYMADNCEVCSMGDVLALTIVVSMAALPVVNGAKWVWRSDLKPFLRKISKEENKGGKPKK